MRYDWRVRAVALLGSVLAAAGCTSTQPSSLGKRIASVRILTKATVPIFDCYELWVTTDGIPQFTGVVECDPAAIAATNRSVPWRFSVNISVIHPGSTTEQIVTSLSGVIGSSVLPGTVDNFPSLTEYDATDQPAAFKPPVDVGGGQTLSFLNGKQVSLGSPVYLSPAGFVLGDTNILTLVPTFDFEVNSGDTVIVRARKQTVALTPHFIPTVPAQDIKLSGTLSIGGSLVAPAGITSSTFDDKAGISFSFTVQ